MTYADAPAVREMRRASGGLVAEAVSVVVCHDCGAVQRMPRIRSGYTKCLRCGAVLERAAGRSIGTALACAMTTLILLVPANLMVLLHGAFAGLHLQSHIVSGVGVMWHQGWVLTAAVVAAEVVVLPFLRFGLLTATLGALRLGMAGRWIGPAFRWADHLDLWAMPDVFLVGCAVGYGRIAARVPLHIGPGGWCLIAASLMTMVTRASLDRRQVWRRIGDPPPPPGKLIGCPTCMLPAPAQALGGHCRRCGQRLWRRRRQAVPRAAALTFAALLMYPLANIFPMSRLFWPGGAQSHTIFRGVQDLAQAQFWGLAALIFTASIAIPLLKLVGMGWFLLSVRRRSRRALRLKTRLYRLIDGFGRWSMIDVFTIAVFAPLGQFGALAQIRVGGGTPAFMSVVLLTMLASSLFDPRLLWDALEDEA